VNQKTILTFLLLLCCLKSIAQTPSFFTIGAEEFSNTDVYTLHYDDETDILFAGTNRGVYSYVQNKFSPVVSNKKQIGNSFFQLKEDRKGRLFCANLTGQIFEIKENKLNLFYQTPNNEHVLDFSYYFDNENNLITNTKRNIRKVTLDSDSILLNAELANEIRISIATSTQFSDGSIYFGLNKTSHYYSYNNGKLSKINFQNSKVEDNLTFFQLGKTKYYSTIDAINRLDGKPFKANEKFDVKSSLYQLKTNEVAIKNLKTGFNYIRLKNGRLEKTLSGFNNTFISTITQNKNNTTFLGTFKEGIIVIPNKKNIKQRVNYALTGITTSSNNSVYLSDKKGNIFKNNNGLEKYGQYTYNIDNLFFLEGKYNIENTKVDSIIHKVTKNKTTSFSIENFKDIEEYKNDFVLFISSNNIQVLVADASMKISPVFAKKRTNTLYRIELDSRGKSITYINNDNSLYYSTNLNVYAKKWNTSKIETIKFKGDRILGNDLINYQKQLIIGSEKNGVLFYKNKIFQQQITTKQGLKSNTILKLKITNDLLFILTTKGIQVYDIRKNKFIGLGEREGVLSEKVTNFALSKDKLWLLDKEGYYSYDLQLLQTNENITLGKVYLDAVVVNNKKINSSTTFNFAFDENKFQFIFDYRDIETKSEAIFKYKLIGASDTWKTLDASVNKIEFTSLSSGKYTFVLKANYRNKETTPIAYKFEISPPFWFQLWFIILSIALIIFIVSMVFTLKIRKKDKVRKIELKTQKMQTDIFESKLKAIRSQMNPHFIFNSCPVLK
jgi:hypothetical protein